MAVSKIPSCVSAYNSQGQKIGVREVVANLNLTYQATNLYSGSLDLSAFTFNDIVVTMTLRHNSNETPITVYDSILSYELNNNTLMLYAINPNGNYTTGLSAMVSVNILLISHIPPK